MELLRVFPVAVVVAGVQWSRVEERVVQKNDYNV